MSIRTKTTPRAVSEKRPQYVVRRAKQPPADAVRLRWQAYERFQQQIIASRIRPGQFVSQRELAALIDLPLGAIREVIPRLEAEGLLQTAPQRGLQIASVDVKLVRNAFQLRSMIEREAASQFSLTATDAELDALEASHRSVIERSEHGVTPALLDEAQAIDWGLHDRMVDALGNEIISNLYRVNSLRIRLIRLDRVMLDEQALGPAMTEHLALIAALRTRDPGHAIAAIDAHLMHARNRALGL
ncbi:MAG: GntR family transcriptional regulator [Casimicrobiaceae bacterium]